jgi:hypothetical protein
MVHGPWWWWFHVPWSMADHDIMAYMSIRLSYAHMRHVDSGWLWLWLLSSCLSHCLETRVRVDKWISGVRLARLCTSLSTFDTKQALPPCDLGLGLVPYSRGCTLLYLRCYIFAAISSLLYLRCYIFAAAPQFAAAPPSHPGEGGSSQPKTT